MLENPLAVFMFLFAVLGIEIRVVMLRSAVTMTPLAARLHFLGLITVWIGLLVFLVTEKFTGLLQPYLLVMACMWLASFIPVERPMRAFLRFLGRQFKQNWVD